MTPVIGQGYLMSVLVREGEPRRRRPGFEHDHRLSAVSDDLVRSSGCAITNGARAGRPRGAPYR
jgi:hypothetical protein